jgi:hypothetical protein
VGRAAHEQVQWDGDRAVDRGQDQQQVTPAEGGFQGAGERKEDAAGESGDHGEGQQRGAALPRSEPGHDDGERRFVQHRGGHQPERDQHGVELPDRAHLRPGDHQRGGGD